ncbi:MAG: hypothetical protein ACLRSY_05055 [Acutalibacter sp.]
MTALGIEFEIDPGLSAAWITTPAPCSSSPPRAWACPGGGGRYDGLAEEFGGAHPRPGQPGWTVS